MTKERKETRVTLGFGVNILNIAIRDLSTNVLVYALIVGLYFLWASYLGDRLVKINGP